MFLQVNKETFINPAAIIQVQQFQNMGFLTLRIVMQGNEEFTFTHDEAEKVARMLVAAEIIPALPRVF